MKLPTFLCPLGYDRNWGFCYEIYIKRKTGVRKNKFRRKCRISKKEWHKIKSYMRKLRIGEYIK